MENYTHQDVYDYAYDRAYADCAELSDAEIAKLEARIDELEAELQELYEQSKL